MTFGKSIILMGIKHCGKSTQGRFLSRELNMPLYDTDDVVQELYGRSPREIYTQEGQEAFLKAESLACAHIEKLLEGGASHAVIATGGGICSNTAALETLHNLGVFVFLQADEKIASDRIVREAKLKDDGSLENLPAYIAKKNPRSIKEVRDLFHDFYVERTKIYSSLADVTVPMDNQPKAVNMSRILNALKTL